jgi:Nucleotidyl transferase AbiEii toxin, Type IV TA system
MTDLMDFMAAIFSPSDARLLEVALPVCERYGLVLAGGHAVVAHGVVVRPTRGVDLATAVSTPIGEIAAALTAAYRAAGFAVADRPGDDPVVARLAVTLEPEGAVREVGIFKEPLSRPPVRLGVEGFTEPLPVAALEDCAAMKTTALGGRAVPRDLIDVHGMTTYFSQGELLTMAAAFDEDFRPGALAERLDKLASLDDRAYTSYGLDEPAAAALRRWAMDWAQDIRLDLMEGMEHPDDFYEPPDNGADSS